MTNHWLFKTDPETYAWSDLERTKKEMWDGVTNPLALKHLRSVRKGDEIFIYHSGNDKAIIGIAVTASDPYPDPSGRNPKLAVIDLVPHELLKRPVRLAEIKANGKLRSWELVRLARLSVMPVPGAHWDEIMRLSRA